MTAIGGNKIGKIYLGSAEVSKMYLGSNLVYQNVVTPPDYLRFTALADGTFTFTIPSGLSTTNYEYVEYSTDDGETWTKTNNIDSQEVVVTTPTILEGDSVLWRGKGTRLASSSSNYSKFTATANFSISGRLNALRVLDNVSVTTVATYGFYGLFYGCTKLTDASGLIAPTGTAEYGLGSTFRGCSYLLYSPVLETTALTTNCYRQLFYGCTRLEKLRTMAKSASTTNAYYQWLQNVSTSCLLVANYEATDTFIGKINTINLTYILYDKTNDKYYLSDRTTECDEDGNVI